MDRGGGWRGEPPRIRTAVHPSSLAPRRRHRGAILPPFLRGCLEQALAAGPVCGMLGAVYSYHLSQTGAPHVNRAAHQVVRQAQMWRGHVLRTYYITPAQNRMLWALAIPAVVWLVLVVVTVAVLGMRAHWVGRAGGRR